MSRERQQKNTTQGIPVIEEFQLAAERGSRGVRQQDPGGLPLTVGEMGEEEIEGWPADFQPDVTAAEGSGCRTTNPMYLLDSDVLIDYQRGFPPARAWFRSLEKPPSVPGFAVMELIQDAQKAQQVQEVMHLASPLPVVWPSALDCELALQHFRAYHLSHGLDLLDSLIAACALGSAATLCTLNDKHFRMIPGLEWKRPYQK